MCCNRSFLATAVFSFLVGVFVGLIFYGTNSPVSIMPQRFITRPTDLCTPIDIVASKISLSILEYKEYGVNASAMLAFHKFMHRNFPCVAREKIFPADGRSCNVIVTVFRGGAQYRNWINNFRFHLIKTEEIIRTLFVGLNAEDCDKFDNCWIDSSEYLLKEDAIIPAGRPVVLKYLYLNELIKLGYNALFLDTDVVVMKPVLPLFERYFSYDIMGLSDQWRAITQETIPAIHAYVAPKNLCGNMYDDFRICQSTGVMFMRRSMRTISFLEHMVRGLAVEPKLWEQYRFQLRLPLFMYGVLNYDPVKYRILDSVEAANLNSFDQLVRIKGWNTTVNLIHMLHVGWIHGIDKVVAYDRYNLWAPYTINNALRTKDDVRRVLKTFSALFTNKTIRNII